ncbi:MAG: MFS transporter [Chloroherpetonaceae bacterium]|nr:MFS transporter [Chloroherpetonaceae bacterium]
MHNTRPASPEIALSAYCSARLLQWQRLTLILLTVGYAGYYICRSNLSVTTPLLIKEFGAQGLNKEAIGTIVSWGTLAYAFGKFFGGSLSDLLSGRRMFLAGMAGSVLCTVIFALGGPPVFTLAWVCNRAIQSVGWSGIVRIASRWYAYSSYGAIMGTISLSFLFGDFFSRLLLGQLIVWGLHWQGVFYVAALSLGIIFLINLFLLRETPQDIGEAEPRAHPNNLFGEAGQTARLSGPSDLLLPLLRNPLFWTVCALSFGFTIVRETFNTWTPQYLHEVAGLEEGRAASASALFPLFGGISVLVAGTASDRLGRGGRAGIILLGLLCSMPLLLLLGLSRAGTTPAMATALLALVAFALIGPYSFLAGAIALDFGGKRASATACGWIDGIGYLGGVLAGKGVGALAERSGWSIAFICLAGITAVSCLFAAYYWYRQCR